MRVGRCFDCAQHERGVGAVLRLVCTAGFLFDPSPAEAGVLLGDGADGCGASLLWPSPLGPVLRRGGVGAGSGEAGG